MQSCKQIMQHRVRTGLKGASAGCLCCLCRLQSDNVALDHTVKAEANARAANKKEFLDKMARMSAHVESLKVQRRCHPSTFSIGPSSAVVVSGRWYLGQACMAEEGTHT